MRLYLLNLMCVRFEFLTAFLGYYAMSTGKQALMFWKSLVPLSSNVTQLGSALYYILDSNEPLDCTVFNIRFLLRRPYRLKYVYDSMTLVPHRTSGFQVRHEKVTNIRVNIKASCLCRYSMFTYCLMRCASSQ